MRRKRCSVERGVLNALGQAEHLSTPKLAMLIYGVDQPSRAQLSSVRRALAALQKQGRVVKLGALFEGERCSYAVPDNAFGVLRRLVDVLGKEALSIDSRLAKFYADRIATLLFGCLSCVA